MPRFSRGLRTKAAFLLAFCVVALFPGFALAYSIRGFWAHNLRQIALAFYSYHDVYKHLPSDIVDKRGEPLLSWRVGLLPFLEQDQLYRKFHLDEPWDSPHNLRLVSEIPPYYVDPLDQTAQGLTRLVVPRGPQTAIQDGGRRMWKVLTWDPAWTIMLVEADPQHAVVWTKPEDLPYDPAHPRRGLNQEWSTGLEAKGAFAVFADSSIRIIPGDVDPDLLRALFDAGREKRPRTELAWYEAMCEKPVGALFWPALAISLVAIAGGSLVAFRLLRHWPVAPGEMLWLILGAGQLTLVIAFLLTYEYELIPSPYPYDSPLYWFLPRLAATAACAVTVRVLPRGSFWKGMYGATLVLLALVTLNALSPQQHRMAEESLVTLVGPVVLAITGTVATLASLIVKYPGWPQRRLAHWIAIVVVFVPLAWFLFAVCQGWTIPRELFVRVLE
jgi:hypothetical protein